ncbi:competence/damage-inducible protein A [bacterium]|nr:competence/damage-inducible protein A [bacterium]RQV92225.1 MAG: competence/damage-inducible protein A [bacterium]
MKAEIITIGEELINGMTTNTNASYVGRRLSESGIEVRWMTTVGDHIPDIKDALQRAFERAAAIVLTGGLGPTHDDVTKKAVAQFFHSNLVFREDLYNRIVSYFDKRGIPIAEINREQAEVPEEAGVIENEIGTAVGLKFEKEKRTVFVLPGVPAEMKKMMEESVLPSLNQEGRSRVQRSLILHTAGIAESELYHRVKGFEDQFPEVKLAFLPKTTGVVMRLTIFGSSADYCEDRLNRSETYIRKRVDQYILGSGETTIEEVVAHLLLKNHLTLAVAESCTGGLVAHKLTNVPGSSGYFIQGLICYSNASKIRLLDVPEKILSIHGAVSGETAYAMAEAVRCKSGTDIGIATTGIAGPTGGTSKKPVGLVYVGYSDQNGVITEKHQFMKSRLWNKERSAVAVLDLVRRVILDYVKIGS